MMFMMVTLDESLRGIISTLSESLGEIIRAHLTTLVNGWCTLKRRSINFGMPIRSSCVLMSTLAMMFLNGMMLALLCFLGMFGVFVLLQNLWSLLFL